MAKKQNNNYRDWLHRSLLRLCHVHFLFLIPFVVQIVAYAAWHVLVPQMVLARWLATGGLLAVTVVVWYLAHNHRNDIATYKRLVFLLILADIALAAFNIYIQRGMASRAVMLFALPIVVSSVLLSSAALYTTAALCAVSYATSAISYFVLNFNEGYKTELYGEVSFYCATFFILAASLAIVVRFGRHLTDE